MQKDYNISAFNDLPDNSRLWIYQSNRALTDAEVNSIQQELNAFVQEWTSHSREVIAEGAVLFNRFIVLAADETAFTVSGCSIDSSVHFMKELQTRYELDLFDRLSVAYKDADGQVQVVNRKAFRELLEQNQVNDTTPVFNNTITSKAEFGSKWLVPLSESWHARVFA